jgi:hypothetical protein
MQLERLFAPEEILNAAREAAKHPSVLRVRTLAVPGPVMWWKEAPPTGSHRCPWPGGFPLRVPLDARAEALAKRMILRAEPEAGRSGLELLGDFDSPANRALARSMLADTRSVVSRRGPDDAWPRRIDYLETRSFVVRAAATEALARWREPARGVVLVESTLPYRRLGWPWWLAGVAAGFAVAMLVRRRHRRRRRAFDPPFRKSRWQRVFDGAALVSFVMALATVVLWIRSYWVVDNLVVPTEAAEHEISSAMGRLRYLSLQDRPTMSGAVWGRQWTDQLIADWHATFLTPAVGGEWTRFGFGVDDGRVQIYRYRRYWVRMGNALLVFLIVPAVWAVRAWRRHLLKRRREWYGLCPACGYDIRATPGRCPECGWGFGAELL